MSGRASLLVGSSGSSYNFLDSFVHVISQRTLDVLSSSLGEAGRAVA